MTAPTPKTAPRPIWARLLAVVAVACLGLVLWAAFPLGAALAVNSSRKMAGASKDCPWDRLIAAETDRARLRDIWSGALNEAVTEESDARLGLVKVRTPQRSFWVKRDGHDLPGRELIAYLLADHQWLGDTDPGENVQPGNVVIDCGAHVGVFTHFALKRGASKVVAIEPDPANLECLRRNYAAEIAAGRVVLVPKGAWNEETTLKLYSGDLNSGSNSVIQQHAGAKSYIEIPVTTIDGVVASLGLARVDFIKMDIEGAEREALAGARNTLAQFKPRLMLDAYHLPDDMTVLPRVIAQARGDYSLHCGPCEEKGRQAGWIPHVVYMR